MIKFNTPPLVVGKAIARIICAFVLAFVFITATQSSAFAAGSITVYNYSGVRIDAIYCCEQKYPGWADDKLGNGYLNSGSSFRINFSSARYVKLQIHFSNGSVRTWNNIDLNAYDKVTVRHT